MLMVAARPHRKYDAKLAPSEVEPSWYAAGMLKMPLPSPQANTFSQFTNSLVSTTRHQARTFSQQSSGKQIRTIGYIVLGVLVVWFLGKWWFSSSPSSAAAAGDI
jgi:hypothetical protein